MIIGSCIHSVINGFVLRCAVDEGQPMTNTQLKLMQTLTTYYHSKYRLILTGTLLQNHLSELWALLSFGLPMTF